MNNVRRIFEDGLALAKEGDLNAALSKFKEALRQAPPTKEKLWVGLCHRNIAMIHELRGELLKAKRSHLNALKYRGPDPYTYHWLGTLSESRGEVAAAKRYFARCEELATLEKDEDLLKLLANRKRSKRFRK